MNALQKKLWESGFMVGKEKNNPDDNRRSQSERTPEAIVSSLPVGVIVYDEDLRIVEYNPEAGAMIDIEGHEFIHVALSERTCKNVWLNWEEHLRGAMVADKMSRLDNVSYAFGDKTKLLRVTCGALRQVDSSENIGGMVVIEDVTESVAIQKHLAATERLAAMGKVAARVAHELNNPMDGILRYLNMAIRTMSSDNTDKPREYLLQCREGLMRMVQVISELLEFSRSGPSYFECTSVDKIIEDAIKIMDGKIKAANLEVVRDYSKEVPMVRSGSLFQVFCNLIKNAADAVEGGGKLNIKTWLIDQETAAIEFRDTGIGFDDANAEAIFEPFYTTKVQGKGTGLGLAVCKDIVEKCNGKITATGAPGVGSVFTVYLPIKNTI